MDIKWFLLSLQGRVNRAPVWAFTVAQWAIMFLIVMIGPKEFNPETGMDEPTSAVAGILMVFFLALLWPNLAVAVKRCHDRGRSGWFILVSFIPVVNIWYLIEVMFLRGTLGDNQYGPDPLGG